MANGQRPVLCFDGSGAIVNIGKRAEHKIQRDITMEAMIYPTHQIQWAGILSRIYDTGATESGYCLLLDGQSGIYCGIRTVSGPSQDFYHSSGPGTLTLNEWHHVAATYDGKQIVIYIDGEPKKAVPCAGDIDYEPDHPLTIGAYRDDNDNYVFPGKIAEVRLWTVVRTAAQLKAAMNTSLRGDEEGLVGYWPLDEGSGETVKDRSKNAIVGTISRATWEMATVAVKKAPELATQEALLALERDVKAIEELTWQLEGRVAAQDRKIAGIDEVNAAQDLKMAGFDEKLAASEQRLAGFDGKLAAHEQRLDDVERRGAAHGQRMEDLEARVAKCSDCCDTIAAQQRTIGDLSTRLAVQERTNEQLEAKIARAAESDDRLAAQQRTLQELAAKLDELAKEVQAAKAERVEQARPEPAASSEAPQEPTDLDGLGPKLFGLLKKEGISALRSVASSAASKLKSFRPFA